MNHRTRLRAAFILAASLSATALAGGSGAVLVETRFSADSQGWSHISVNALLPGFTIINTYTSTWFSTNGNPGGYIRHSDPDDQYCFWRAPAAYLGDQSGAYGGTLSFDQFQTSIADQFNVYDVVLQGAGLTLMLDFPYFPETRWSRSHVLLTEKAGWRIDTLAGAAPTQEQFQAVLADLDGLFIRSEYKNGADTNGIDNVVLRAANTTDPSSDFSTDSEEWWVLNDVNPPVWDAAGGNPGGVLRATDIGDGRIWYFYAPSRYLGDRARFVGGTLRWDARTTDTNTPRGALVILRGGGLSLEFIGPVLDDTNWTTLEAPLSPGPGWSFVGAGGTPTAADFQIVLGSLTELSIKGEWSNLVDTGSLDNVMFDPGQCPGDADGDLDVDFGDLNLVLSNFGQAVAPGTGGDVAPDGAPDGFVNFDDLNLVLSNFGGGCAG